MMFCLYRTGLQVGAVFFAFGLLVGLLTWWLFNLVRRS